jgi:hypothetical protein
MLKQYRFTASPGLAPIKCNDATEYVRGIRHRHHRIKLAIGDDIDDLRSVATQESRNSTAQWWRGEVVGALALEARRILIGNWLHLDGLMARMKDSGRYKVLEYPLILDGPGTEWERCTWKAAFPNQEAILRLKPNFDLERNGKQMLPDRVIVIETVRAILRQSPDQGRIE